MSHPDEITIESKAFLDYYEANGGLDNYRSLEDGFDCFLHDQCFTCPFEFVAFLLSDGVETSRWGWVHTDHAVRAMTPSERKYNNVCGYVDYRMDGNGYD